MTPPVLNNDKRLFKLGGVIQEKFVKNRRFYENRTYQERKDYIHLF